MPFRMKRKTPEIVGATTEGRAPAAHEPLDATAPMRSADDRPERGATVQVETRLQAQLDLLRDCAELLLCGESAHAERAFAKLAPALELDAIAAFVATNGEGALVLDTSVGLSGSALSSTSVAVVAADLQRAERRTHVFESLARNSDSRAAVFRELGFASAVVGALVVGGRLLGAVVLAARSKERFSAAELTVIDTLLCYLAAAYERRELTRDRHDSEHRKREFLTVSPTAPITSFMPAKIATSLSRKVSPSKI